MHVDSLLTLSGPLMHHGYMQGFASDLTMLTRDQTHAHYQEAWTFHVSHLVLQSIPVSYSVGLDAKLIVKDQLPGCMERGMGGHI
jgi:hypothetical protein